MLVNRFEICCLSRTECCGTLTGFCSGHLRVPKSSAVVCIGSSLVTVVGMM